jgi:hypothetical protein
MGFHLVDVYIVPRAGLRLKAGLGIIITIVSGLFVFETGPEGPELEG